MQVFGRRQRRFNPALRRPASEKRQSTKSRREMVRRRCRIHVSAEVRRIVRIDGVEQTFDELVSHDDSAAGRQNVPAILQHEIVRRSAGRVIFGSVARTSGKAAALCVGFSRARSSPSEMHKGRVAFNLKTTKALGLGPPIPLLARADQGDREPSLLQCMTPGSAGPIGALLMTQLGR